MSKDKSVDLGKLQDAFELAEREYRQSEREFAKAGETRRVKKAKFEAADQALRAGVQAVQG